MGRGKFTGHMEGNKSESDLCLEADKETWEGFYQHGLILIPPCINNHMLSKVWVEST